MNAPPPGGVKWHEGASDGQVADWLADRLGAALAAAGGPVPVAFPGGSTPTPILELLTRHDLPFGRLTVWPTDDRAVPADHPASNEGALRTVLKPAGARVAPLTIMEKVPRFALVWLGMGEDGHVASLFPSTDPRADDPAPVRRITPDPLPPDAPFERVTLTLPALLATDTLLLVTRGEAKRRVLRAAADGENDLPVARLLRAAKQPVACFT